MSSRVLNFKIPIDILAPTLSSSLFVLPLQVFGCVCFVHLYGPSRGKLDPRALKCIFLGYSLTQKGYQILSSPLNKAFCVYGCGIF
jgi:hypothetical protein